MVHEIGNRTYVVARRRPAGPRRHPHDAGRYRALGLAFVLLLPFYGRLKDDGHLWWLWTCVAGFGLGLVGWDHCRRRRKRHEAGTGSPDLSVARADTGHG